MKENILIKRFRKEKFEKGLKSRTRPYVRFICWRCNKEVEMAENKYDSTKPCKECCKSVKAEKRFFEKAYEKYGDRFDLSKVKYIDSKTKVTVRCKKHNYTYSINPLIFTGKGYPNKQVPMKGGCKYCAKESHKESVKKSIDYYLKILNDRFPQFKVIEHGQAESNLEKIKLYCNSHGEFTKTLAKIVSKESVYLCPSCSIDVNAWKMRTARTDVKGYVYFIFLENLGVYKLGVTYRNIEKRLNEFKEDMKLKWLIELDTLAQAYTLEYCLFQKYKDLRYKGERLLPTGGYTELITQEIDKPTERFIEEILCLKESNSGKLLPSSVEDNPERKLK